MSNRADHPIVLAFAGPNGSGKSTLADGTDKVGTYVNADDIKQQYGISDMQAAIMAESLRNKLLDSGQSFTFETVLSTDRNLKLLQKAKHAGYEVQCFYVLTVNPDINAARVRSRVAAGGHDVPLDKIYSRYKKALKLIPALAIACDKLLVYDNSMRPMLIYEKMYTKQRCYPNTLWSKPQIKELLGLP